MALGAVVAVVVATVGLFAFGRVQWPAFTSSNLTQAVTTVLQVVTLAVIGAAVVMFRARRYERLAKLLSWAGLSGFVTTTLGLPLAATTLYLHGVSVDQQFRTEYLTRLTDSAALHDMTYVDLPPYYPAGWFWAGGRVANLLGMDGWEAFKPYAIGSLAVMAVVALVLWTKLVRRDWAVVAATAVTAVVLAYNAPEAYGAVVNLLIAPVLILAWGALNRPGASRFAGAGAILGTGVFLGYAATVYTLYLAFAAFAVTLMAVASAGLAVRAQHSWKAVWGPLIRLAAVAVVAGLIALTVWAPYLVKALAGATAESGTAMHYLPKSGAVLPFPMLEFSLAGGLCLLGTIWLVSRFLYSRRAQALGIGVIAVYLFALLSMLVTVAGTTLLGFRLEPVLIALLAAAGVFGFFEFAGWIVLATSENPRVKAVLLTLGVIGAIAFAQNIPQVLAPDIAVAYSDTDGNGERGDKRPPGAEANYADVDRIIGEQLARPANETVVLTADIGFLSFYPYYGFQGLTSHYANPLADFRARADLIAKWSELTTPDELVAALDSAPWRAPDVFLFRQGAEGYTLRLAEDVYPNDPNVRRYTVTFPKELFDDPRFTVTEQGPFVVITRA
ncbi:galactan 5-O-arabinofuranosyltransferase [Rhodococcus sp. 27YEA15]|uniref:galactan 5-O-arabinofuranosyltransferase n=1 Tax=Rhodococcus sp. 27YEA15 TaxID=3156259 RepID=UPI003C7D5CEC